MRIHKYVLSSRLSTQIRLSFGWKLLSLQKQYSDPVIWVLEDPSCELKETVSFAAFHTGDNAPAQSEYAGTIQFNEGSYILHFFYWRG